MPVTAQTQRRSAAAKAASIHPAVTPQRLTALVSQIAAGHPQALSSLYELTVTHVFAIAQCILRSKEDAEEVVCDVYVNVWQQANSFDSSRGNVMAWLVIMTKNRAIDRIRKRRNTVSLDDDGDRAVAAFLVVEERSPDQILAQFQSGTAVHRALGLLTPLRRRLVGLAFFQGLSHQEIAQAVGMPLGTVKSHVRRALATLQSTLSIEDKSSVHARPHHGARPHYGSHRRSAATAVTAMT